MSDVMQHNAQSAFGIYFSDSARTQVLSYFKKNEGSKGIRLSVKKTGCSGLSYVIDYVSAPKAGDVEFPFDDFYWVYVDKKSYPYLKGMQIDYVKQGLNQKMVYSNPNQTGQCGCGESFTVDEM